MNLVNVKNVRVEERISKKDGKTPYTLLIVTLVNGFELQMFLNNEQKFIIESCKIK